MVKITDVEHRSPAYKKRIRPGDILVKINGNEIRDVLDYRFYLAECVVVLDILRDGKSLSVKIKKKEYDDIGLGFETPLMDKKHTCKNKCIFCFIDQNPEGLRDSLYFKDDDSRLSFIHGNYVTLTNMTREDVDRIIKMRMSPINISVHTTNPDLRVEMMKNKHAGEVLSYLDLFKEAGLDMCGQIVLCKGFNDGEELTRTLSDLSELYPAMSSVAVVPAGLTAYREGLCSLSDFTKDEAARVIDEIDRFAKIQMDKHGSRQFFAADEFYLKAGRSIPDSEYYEDYPQLENGVGMLRLFSEDFDIAMQSIEENINSLESKRCVTVVTGAAAYDTVTEFAKRIESLTPLIHINVKKIINYFYGESITVTGLLTGKDIAEQLSGVDLGDEVILPSNCLRYPEEDFLCGMSLLELKNRLGVPVRVISDGEFIDAVFGQ